MVVPRHDTAEHPDAEQVWEKVKRAYQREKASHATRQMLDSIRTRTVLSESGFQLGKVGLYDIELNPIRAVGEKCIMGLFYREKGYRLPEEYEVDVCPVDQLSPDDREQVSSVFAPVIQSEQKEIGNSTFRYSVEFDPNPSDESQESDVGAFYMCFYEGMELLGVTVPEHRGE